MDDLTQISPAQLGDVQYMVVEVVDATTFRARVAYTADGAYDAEGEGPTIAAALEAAVADLMEND
ncbi:hypothetical protein [Actinomadura kijaniata]|uniref:hypothetical protein n=1 Tax=Actinomadura kijaniata TaxID=46161 RepID=UPI00082F131E|nr:hypothetical protein [Actinomadura kijaniata]